MQEINEFNLKEAFESKKPTVLKFYAEWCGPCRSFAPIMDNVSHNTQDVNFYGVDIDNHYRLAREMQVSNIPATVLVIEGVEVARFVGLKNGKQVKEWLDKNLTDS